MRAELFGNRYRIKGLIGEGGMASVYSAIDEKLDRRVAIKILHAHLARNPDIRLRFDQEARSISGIDHPNIIKIFDFSGDHSEQLWIVTEILYGVDLAEYVKRFQTRRLHSLVATLIAREICKALSEAHRHGIVHRDIKPENIMVLDSGRIKLMDFGIAKVAQNPSATQTGTFMGSPSYMSPEQIKGIKVDSRTDIYSISVLFYEIVTGVLPFTGNSTHDVINKIMIGKFSPPININPELPLALNQMILRGMHSNREKRYRDINHLAADLDQFLIGCGFEESHVELERFFRSPKEFERKLVRFDETRQTRPLKIKTAAAKSLDKKARKESQTPNQLNATTQMMIVSEKQVTRSLDQVKEQKIAASKVTDLIASKATPNLDQNTIKINHQPQINAELKRSAKIGNPAQMIAKSSPRYGTPLVGDQNRGNRNREAPVIIQHKISHPNSNRPSMLSNLFWNSVLIASIAGAIILGIKIFSDRQPNSNQIASMKNSSSPGQQDFVDKKRNLSPSKSNLTRVDNRTNKTQSPEKSVQEPKVEKVIVRSHRSPATPEPSTYKDAAVSEGNTPRPPNYDVVKNLKSSTPALLTEKSLTPGNKNDSQNNEASKSGITIPSKPSTTSPGDLKIADILPTVESVEAMTKVDSSAENLKDLSADHRVDRQAIIKIYSTPAADIFINEERHGKTSDSDIRRDGIKLSPGSYQLALKRPGFETVEETINIEPQSSQTLQFRLNKKAATVALTFQTNRVPALAYIDQLTSGGKKDQITLTESLQKLTLQPSTYHIEVVFGGQTIERIIEIRANSDPITFNAIFD